jgi:hypothetical protein
MLESVQALLGGALSITVGTRNSQLRPHFARALAIRLGPKDGEATVFVSTTLADELVSDLRNNGQIAVTLTDMNTIVSRQLKGTFVDMADSGVAKEPFIAEMRERSLKVFGDYFGAGVAEGLGRIPTRRMLALTFRVDSVFDQTPRAGAGQRLS